jgi:hypothetical protein
MLQFLSGIDQDIARRFQFDYVILDAVFLLWWVGLLISRKRFAPLAAGVVCGALTYVIDGVIWYSSGVREYGLPAPWMKHPVDFMMDFSYGIVAFSWIWIAFERRSRLDLAFWTAVVLAGWMLVPVVSFAVPLSDAPIMTVRHMQSQVAYQIAAVVVGYALLAVLRLDIRMIGYLFAVGCVLGFMMELPLLVTKIRPASFRLLAFETLILYNQGVPYLYVIWDRILPAIGARAPSMRGDAKHVS